MAGGHEITRRVYYLQELFETHQGRYFKMADLQTYMENGRYPSSTKTIYRDLTILKEKGIVDYDYYKKAYIFPKPPQQEPETNNVLLALGTNRKISFKYFHYSTDRSVPKRYSNKGKPYIGSPWDVWQKDGKQYVYVFLDDKKTFRTYRTDRIEDIQILKDSREGEKEYKSQKEQEQLNTRKEAKVFDSYKGKKTYNVRIRFINSLLEQVYDEFGRDIVFIRDDDGKHFIINERISVSPPFYAWVATFGHSVKILSPKDAIKGMKKFLQDAADMYKDDGEM